MIKSNPKDSNYRMNSNPEEMNPKDSNVYSTNNAAEHTTPKGSHNSGNAQCYKHIIPSGLKTEK